MLKEHDSFSTEIVLFVKLGENEVVSKQNVFRRIHTKSIPAFVMKKLPAIPN